jgi:uncharacterized protein (TIGR04222 family)
MKLTEHISLWNKIQRFEFDDSRATITFSKKLADQQRWSASYTQRVIEEYRRFIFLCCISPNGASPSKAVDEAWHLHLTYTQSYWNAFCKNTLGKDIHHNPSSGGEQEDHKHTNWYAETLSLYAAVFYAPPPADIWPPPVKQEKAPAQSLSMPEEPYKTGMGMTMIVVILLLFPFVINYAITRIVFPFFLTGPQFLLFYGMLVAAALLVHYLMRQDRLLFMKKTVDAVPLDDLNIFQLTHFVYGKERALQTGLVDMYRRELVSIEERKIVGHQNKYRAPEKEDNPLIPALLVNHDESWAYYTDIATWYRKQLFVHPAIEKIFRLSEENEPRRKRYLVILIVLCIGLARILQGWFNDRPVVFLFLEVIALVVAAGLLSYGFSTKTYAYVKLKALLLDKAGSRRLHPDPVVNDFALNGRQVLGWLPATIMLESMFVLFPVEPPSTYNRDSSSSGSSCGSSDSSCSSGSSCSGGGGGGCGGCSGSN